jgi:hypothetical protein
VLRRIFRSKRDEIIGCRKFHDEEFHKLHSSPNKIRMIKSRTMRWVGYVTRMGERREIHTESWWEKPERRRPLGRPRRRWEE